MPELVASIPKPNYRRLLTAVYAAVIAFLAYSSVYAFRKPFTIASFDGIRYGGVSFQTLLIISQVFGYMLSKFYGIKFISALKKQGRLKAGVTLVLGAWFSLLLFALTPAPYSMVFLFCNGFLLGFMWGIIFSYVEGRRTTDFIGTVMAISFIFVGGFTRSVAKWMMLQFDISEKWMPFMTGLVFIGPLLLFIYLLERLPAPDAGDISERTIRQPMDRQARKSFLRSFGTGVVIVTITYLFLTVIRDVRDNYMANIWTELGYGDNYAVFTKTETNTSIILLAMMALLALIRRNIQALRYIHLMIAAGFILAGISSWLFVHQMMGGATWMQLVGLGLYMSYIPFNCIFFERMIATFRIAGNVGFLIYIADAFGYLGSVGVMLSKEFLDMSINWSEFYSQAVVIGSILGLAGTAASFLYFNKRYRRIKT